MCAMFAQQRPLSSTQVGLTGMKSSGVLDPTWHLVGCQDKASVRVVSRVLSRQKSMSRVLVSTVLGHRGAPQRKGGAVAQTKPWCGCTHSGCIGIDTSLALSLSFSLSLPLSDTHTHTHSPCRSLALSLSRSRCLCRPRSFSHSRSLPLALALSLTAAAPLRAASGKP